MVQGGKSRLAQGEGIGKTLHNAHALVPHGPAGCPAACLDIGERASVSLPCKDTDMDSVWNDAWIRWPLMWLTTFNGDPATSKGQYRLALLENISRHVRKNGCNAIQSMNLPKGVPFTGDSVCQGWNGLISSAANLCPETCGCKDPANFTLAESGCPRSCQKRRCLVSGRHTQAE